jgi:Tfp pilus assembly protein PilF
LAAKEAWGWLIDQPFAEEPATFGSCVAEMGLGNYRLAIEFAKAGLSANPRNATLINNLAYALIELGEVDKARKEMQRVSAPPMNDSVGITWKATQGLLAYRNGSAAQGKREYLEAIEAAHRLGLGEREAMASMMLAREEWRLNRARAIPLVRAAMDGIGANADSLLALVARALEDEIASATGEDFAGSRH